MTDKCTSTEGHRLIAKLREPRLGIHDNGEVEFKSWDEFGSEREEAADFIEAMLNELARWQEPFELLEHHNKLEAEIERLREYIETYHDEDYVLWRREQDALLEGRE